jgi:hypothetical protein
MPKRSGVTQFVVAHINQTNEEIIEAAKAEGHEYTNTQIQHARWKINNSPQSVGKGSGSGSGRYSGVTAFVSKHLKLTDDQILEAAKAEGHDWSKRQVNQARANISHAKRTGKGKKHTAPTGEGKGARRGITEFVESHPKLSHTELVKLAEAKGLDYSRNAISQTIWYLKKRKQSSPLYNSVPRAASPNGRPPAQHTPQAKVATVIDAKEQQLRRLIFELGYDRARAVFDDFDHAHQRMK